MCIRDSSYSITVGMGAGFIVYVLLQLVQGAGRRIHPLMYIIAGMFVLYFLRDPLATLIS